MPSPQKQQHTIVINSLYFFLLQLPFPSLIFPYWDLFEMAQRLGSSSWHKHLTVFSTGILLAYENCIYLNKVLHNNSFSHVCTLNLWMYFDFFSRLSCFIFFHFATGSSWFNRLTVKTRTECVGLDKKQIKVKSNWIGCNAIRKDLRAYFHFGFVLSLFCPRCFHRKVYTSAKVSTSPVSVWVRENEWERERERKYPRMQCQQ